MAEKTGNTHNTQLELFSQPHSVRDVNPERGHAFLSRLRAHEKIIITIMAMVISGVISFSLGVEKGKRISLLGASTRMDIAAIQAPQETPAKLTQAPPAPPKETPKESYVIQLASYKTKILAQKEAEVLRKKGFSPLVLSKGSYSVLYVGNFANREKAKLLLGELKKRFKDCYVRRL
jgi:hypothetical protein